MYVEVGNESVIEGYREDGSEVVLYREVPGQFVTRITIPEGTGVGEAFITSLTALGHHLDSEGTPAWIESDSPGLVTLLIEHYGIKPAKNKRPASWGKKK